MIYVTLIQVKESVGGRTEGAPGVSLKEMGLGPYKCMQS